LFIVEAATWSQVVRLLVLARGLDPHKYEVHFASASFDERMFDGTTFKRWPIYSVSPAIVVEGLKGNTLTPVYTKKVLAKYVAEELALYETIHPDLVVQDVRMSTTVSAPAFGVPCANLINAYYTYWSHHTSRSGFPLPEIALFQRRGASLIMKHVLPRLIPLGYWYLASPVNKLRKEHGLPKIGDLIDVFTWGDRLLFPDDPLLVPLTDPAPHEVFLGPILWSPDLPLPEYWDELGRDRPMVYATLGSSGADSVVWTVIEALGSMDVDVLFSTAARDMAQHVPDNVHVVDMIPGDLAARKAAVVVCNGGSSTGYQALAEGTPVVSLPWNPDQVFAAIAMRDVGAGVLLRPSAATPTMVRTAVEQVMREERFTQAAQRVAASFARFDPHARFRAVIDEVTEPQRDDD
jgi:UDP:flavonoid glycosyltransferase YjiC (YdhE family)